MGRRIESLFIAGSAGRLEALIEEPEGAVSGAALVCHPHPKGGGTMHNKVVYRMARALRSQGAVVLRFNYRGVNLSEGAYDGGHGETSDALTALETLAGRYPGVPLTVAGFSFGSRVALRLAETETYLHCAIAAGFPTQVMELRSAQRALLPKYFIQSTHDEYGPADEFRAFYETVPEPKQLEWIEAGDHFFKDALDEFERAVERVALLTSNYSPA